MAAYSQDLRERSLTALRAQTDTRAGIAQTFGVSRSFVQKLWRRWRETGSSAARPHGGRRRRALQPASAFIRKEVRRQPDVTLAELCERVQQALGVQASPSMMWREVQRLPLSRKKSRSTPASGTRRA